MFKQEQHGTGGGGGRWIRELRAGGWEVGGGNVFPLPGNTARTIAEQRGWRERTVL